MYKERKQKAPPKSPRKPTPPKGKALCPLTIVFEQIQFFFFPFGG